MSERQDGTTRPGGRFLPVGGESLPPAAPEPDSETLTMWITAQRRARKSLSRARAPWARRRGTRFARRSGKGGA